MPTPKKDLPAHIREARKQAAERLLREEIVANRQAQVLRRLEDNPAHPATADVVADAEDKAAEARAATDKLVARAGLSRDDITAGVNGGRRAELADQILQWKQLRDIHQDFIDDPEAYNGCDVSGSPLDFDVQRRMVAEYDAAIATAEEEKKSLA